MQFDYSMKSLKSQMEVIKFTNVAFCNLFRIFMKQRYSQNNHCQSKGDDRHNVG